MDVNAALTRIRDTTSLFMDGHADARNRSDLWWAKRGMELAESFRTLDVHLAQGGTLPDAWKENR